MKLQRDNGIFLKEKKLFTINPDYCKNIKVYDEHLTTVDGVQYRSWNPYRSKLAAVLTKKQIILKIQPSFSILYLGAATGTTVSHLSDICIDGWIYALEPSPVVAKTLLKLAKQRKNIIPIIEDANHPNRYAHIISDNVDFIYQDISQRNQAEIFTENVNYYLKNKGEGIIMVKARSIDVALKPMDAFSKVIKHLSDKGLKIKDFIELSPYEKDHAALFILKNKGIMEIE
jgi:fibrillarin-like pre-rRNA processing protein